MNNASQKNPIGTLSWYNTEEMKKRKASLHLSPEDFKFTEPRKEGKPATNSDAIKKHNNK